MNTQKVLDQIAKQLDLRKPQNEALVELDKRLALFKIGDRDLKSIESKMFNSVTFDTEFPSFAFALATGVGKTRLMGAMISYLYHAKNLKDFFILTPSETIYTKTIDNFTTSSRKYVLEGLMDFPDFNLVTGQNYEYSDFGNRLENAVNIYIFNIQKIFNERKDVEFKFHKFQETLGSSFAELLQKKNLVVLMDESHRYRGEKSIRAINHLLPELGLEFTATPVSKNVIYTYSLKDAINYSLKALENLKNGGNAEGGYIKVPQIVARSDNYSYKGDLEQIKLEDGIRLHRVKKALVKTYSENNKVPFVLPITLISTQSIAKAEEVKKMISEDTFFKGYYKDKTLLVTSQSEEEAIQQLLQVEEPYPKNKNEIVIHVDKLKEGWDVKNVYTIIPFRASISKILIEQTIGRGLRLPFGQLTGKTEIDTLDIISHENFEHVLSVAHEVAEGIQTAEAQKRDEPKEIKIEPTNTSKKIQIPLLETKVHSSNKLEFFPIEMRLQQLQKVNPKLIGGNILNKETHELASIKMEGEMDPVNRIVRLIFGESREFDVAEHKEVLQQIVKHYLSQTKLDPVALSTIVKQHDQKILEDVLPQIKEKLQEKTRIELNVIQKAIEFISYSTTIDSSFEPTDRNYINDEDILKTVVSGYKKSIYPMYHFDSRGEKWFADALDNDKSVKAWMKVFIGQLEIKYMYGTYNPDFIVERAEANYLVEVKSKKELDNKDKQVFAKAKQAEEWCKLATKATGKKWIYKLVPHTSMKSIDSFDGIINSAYKIE